MFDVIIVNLNAGSYLRMTPEKALAKAEKKKKDLYLQACLERRRTFTPMVYSADVIPWSGGLNRTKDISRTNQLQAEARYSEMCGFLRARISLEIVRSNSLVLGVPRDKGACIR